MSDPLISIIVLSCGQAAKTTKCFLTISQNCKIPYEVLWVDNNSAAPEFAYIRNNIAISKENYKVIRHDKNLGFVLGVNSAIPHVHPNSKYVILLNNDTEIGPGTFEKLIRPFQDPAVGVTSCITQSKISWQEASNLNRRWKSLKMPHYAGSVDDYTRKLEKCYTGKCVEIQNINFAFFCAAFPRAVFLDYLKGLDTEFEIGLGEDDYACHRLRAANYKFYLVLDAFVYHHHRTTFRALGTNIDNLRRKNVATLRRKVKELKS
jgi:GT2 family glycosyltransferase